MDETGTQRMRNAGNRPTFIDLFCGCGGFTLGMLRAGFSCKAAVDFNEKAISTLRENLQEKTPTGLPPVGYALGADLTQLLPSTLSAIIGDCSIDVIVGGPPCQGFSTARQRDGSNHGTGRLKDDPRRHLYREFLHHVEYFQPKVFVIENVVGLRSAAGGKYFTAVQHEARVLGRERGQPGYRVHAQIESGATLGLPQKRRRQLIVGVRADLPGYFPSELKPIRRAALGAMLGDAIGDLPPLKAGTGDYISAYDLKRREKLFLGGMRDTVRRRYLRCVAEVKHSAALTNHVARPHSERDLRDFERLNEGESSATAMRRGVLFEYPYDKLTFKDRYTRQHRNRPCSTIVAHLGKDGLMFIHPVQNRSITPREAARIQSFPDWFGFPDKPTHAFRLIGNAVPPLVAESVGFALRRFLHALSSSCVASVRGAAVTFVPNLERHVRRNSYAPTDAARDLEIIARLDRRALRALPTERFLLGWHALLFLFPSLHPDNALDHGNDIETASDEQSLLPGFEQLLTQRYTRSGWPVALDLIGKEAWRRFDAGEIRNETFYCTTAQTAGLMHLESLSLLPNRLFQQVDDSPMALQRPPRMRSHAGFGE